MEDDLDDDFSTCKVVLLGESGVGKTSIISRYINNTFSGVLMTTTGASFTTKKVEIDPEHIVTLQIWDTAGQERFRSLARLFYQNAAAAILVYDITRKETFIQLQNYWIKEIKDNASPDIILAIAGNKSDEYEKEEVTLDEGKQFADENKAIFKTTSAMKSQGIDDLFRLIAEKFNDPEKMINSELNGHEAEFRKKIQINNKKKAKEEKSNCC